jgi:hypothetical protein
LRETLERVERLGEAVDDFVVERTGLSEPKGRVLVNARLMEMDSTRWVIVGFGDVSERKDQ